MSTIRTIRFKDHKIRIVQILDETFYVAHDISSALAYHKASDMTRIISGPDKSFARVNTSGGDQQMIVISAWGILAAASRRKTPQAKELCLWIIGHDLKIGALP